MTDQYELSAKTIIEVGCGKGDFLRLLCAGGSNTGLGFDPSYTGPDSYPDIDVTFIREFFDPNTFGCCPDFVCSRHVIEHLEFPLDMLRIIRSAASRNPDCVVYVETPDLLWILQHGAFWDLPYEHCSYFTAETLRWALETAGFEILTVGSAFNGQYLQAEARPAAHECRSLSMGREHIDALAQALGSFSDQYPRAVARQRAYLAEYTCGTGAAIWGAAAKGVTFVNIVDPQQQLVRYLIDINPSKMAKFVPRTAHRVVDPGELLQNPVALVLTMNPNYEAEVRATLARLGVSPKMVSL